MNISSKQIRDLFQGIKSEKGALLLGQEYFRIDDDYYKKVLGALDIKDKDPSLNELWISDMSDEQSRDALKNALLHAAEESDHKPWLRSLLSLGWNIVLSSSVNSEWIKKGVGSNFSLNIRRLNELPANADFYNTFNKKQPYYISLYADESSVPGSEQELRKLKRNTALLNTIRKQMQSYDTYLVVDGIAEDDWFNISELMTDLDYLPYGFIYIFGMSEERLEKVCGDADVFLDLKQYIEDGHILLCEKSLKDTLTELGMVTEEEEDDEDDHEDEVRISLANSDSLWIPRRECSRLAKINITLMRDEILGKLLLTDENKEKYYADFIQQRDTKSWKYFDIKYNGERLSFHVKRTVEGMLENAVANQLGSSNSERGIILLSGNSNSGKTTSLCWLAWHAVREGFRKKKDEKYIVIYISGDPSFHDNNWQDMLSDFIKGNIYNKTTAKGDRIRNVIVIWDNYNCADKRAEYVQLYNKLNECNAILVGSIYSFESPNNSAPIQGIGFSEMKLSPKLDGSAWTDYKMTLRKINQDWAQQADRKTSGYLFEDILNIANYNYSSVWEQVRLTMRAGLSNEAFLTEKVSGDLLSIFKNKNADDFDEVKKTVHGLGIGAKYQSKFITVPDIQKQEKNVSFINSIRDMNLILAVAGQFKKAIRLPMSVIMATIGEKYTGDVGKLKKILRSDSMVEFDGNSMFGDVLVSFRHPSEAVAYLQNNLGEDRKKAEVDVLKRVIRNCSWDVIGQAREVSAFVRSFGTNSYGKYETKENERHNIRGHFDDYAEYGLDIVNELLAHASGNADAMLIVGHFTRDHVEKFPSGDDLKKLKGALEKMDEVVKSDTYTYKSKSTCSRLYGEMCRNLLQQIKLITEKNDPELLETISYDYDDFETYFKDAVKYGKESNYDNKKFSMIQLLDIWLSYVLSNKERQDQLISDTLDYINMLLYDEINMIDDQENYVNVIRKIKDIYEIINSKQDAELKEAFSNSGNDSYVYFSVNQVLVKNYYECMKEYPVLFNEDNGQPISSRLFFLNEFAAKDIYQLETERNSRCDYDANGRAQESFDAKATLDSIKRRLNAVSGEVIDILEKEYDSIRDMSFRCLVLYLKAKWMNYTNNLLLEYEQTPALSIAQWKELYDICENIVMKKPDEYYVPRSVGFIIKIYRYLFEGEAWGRSRHYSDMNKRIICLCKEDGAQRVFNISAYSDGESKLKAQIDYEVVDGVRTKDSKLVGKKDVFISRDCKDYSELKTNNLNIRRDYAVWFNLDGPVIRDIDLKGEV